MRSRANELLTWSAKYNLGITFADNHHKELLDVINRLHQALVESKGKVAIGQTLNELIRYAKVHFAAEEKVLQSYGYPDSSGHHSDHECLAYALLEFYQKVMSDEAGMAAGSADFLKRWLGTEILEADIKFVSFLKDKGVH
jgi:hemerythrin-like metal-binding protein